MQEGTLLTTTPFHQGVSGGGKHKSCVLARYYVFNANISLTFQAIKNLYAHLTYLCFWPVCKFFGDF